MVSGYRPEISTTVKRASEILVNLKTQAFKPPHTYLAAFFELDERILPEISLRIKFAQSSQVMAVAMADGRFYSTRKTVRVETGGCDD